MDKITGKEISVIAKGAVVIFLFITCLFLLAGCTEKAVKAGIDFIQSATVVLVIVVCFAGIVFVIWISLIKIENKHAAVVVSSVICSLIMIPLIISVNHYIQKKVIGDILRDEEDKIQLLRKENEVRRLEQQKLEDEIKIAKQSIEIENLNRKNMLLERAKLQMQGFQQIAELALTQAPIKYTLVRQEPTTEITDSFWKIKAEYYHDEVLVVTNYDINAKFGIDLKDVKIIKSADKTVIVSGIRPKFIGTDKWERHNIIREIRRVDYKYGEWFRSRILDARQNQILADIKEQQYDMEFNQRVRDGMELAFMDEVIIQLAQNFIKIVLAPIYDNIIFDNINRPEALYLMDFLSNELRESDEEKYKLLQISEQIALNIDLFDAEANKTEAIELGTDDTLQEDNR